MRSIVASLCLFLTALTLTAQTDRGTITGTISDPAGAVIAGALVEAKNADTGTLYQAGSSATGNYTLAQLPAGTYELTVAVPGFKKDVHPGVIVSVANTVRVDFALEVGAASESVTVEAEAPLLKTESGELSHTVEYNRVDSLPLLTLTGSGTGLGNVRNPLQVTTLLPGADFSGENTLRINGMPSSSQAIRIEGQDATNGMWREINQNVQASVDAIQEVSVQTSNFAAEYGQVGGGYFNYTMKSGTNQYHGSAYDYFDNEALNAGTPFTDAGVSNSLKEGQHIRNVVRRNDYGFTLGGPVDIPHIYNGRDKTFFFFNFEQFREGQVNRTGIATVPTSAYTQGDFSGAKLGPLTAFGKPLVDSLGQQLFQNEIFDPASTQIGPDGSAVRTPFTNNTIPAARMDPVALKIQSMFPAPLGALSGQAINNYATPAYTNFRHTTIPSVKIDHSLSSTVKLSGYWQQTHTVSPAANGFAPTQFPWSAVEPTDTINNTGRINYDQTLRPTLLLHLGVGLFYTAQPAVAPKFDQTTLGASFAPFYINQFPAISGLNDFFRGGTSVGVGPGFSVFSLKDVKPTANASMTWVKGNHTYKFGGEMVVEGFPQVNYTRANGQFGFGPNQTGNPWEYNRGSFATTGFGYASFLMGLDSSLTVSQVTDSRIGDHSLGFYAQDTWKVTRKFTLDYGLRYDYETLLREEHGRMQSVSFTQPNPLASNRPGSAIYEATCHCQFNKNYPFAFGPRLGAAYQITPKTVFRAGAGLAYSSSPENAYLSYSVPDFYTFTAPAGAYTSVSQLSGGNPFAPGNPYGNAPVIWPDFTPHYPVSFNGTTTPQSPFIYIDRNAGRPPRIFQWSIGLQREVANNLVVEASYVGNRGVWWTAPVLSIPAYNTLTPQGLLATREYGAAQGIDVTNANDLRLLNLPISNPAVIARFPQLANPNSVYQGFPASQPLKQALRPEPQWGGVPPFLGPPLGDTWYDSLQAKVTKRYSHGLDLQASFTWQKELTNGANSDTSYLTPNPPIINDVFNYGLDKQLSGFDLPYVLVLSANYTTQKLKADSGAMRAFSWIARDWVLGTVLRYQSGTLIRTPATNNGYLSSLDRDASLLNNPVLWGCGFGANCGLQNRVAGQPLLLVDPNSKSFDPTTQLALNPKAWQDSGPGQLGTAAPYYNDLRWQRQPAESISLGRTFAIREGMSFNIRAEFYNMFNRLFFSAPSATNPAAFTTHNSLSQLTGGYGYVNYVNGVGDQPRSGQIVARFQF